MRGKQAKVLGTVLFAMSMGMAGLCAHIAQADSEVTPEPTVSAESTTSAEPEQSEQVESDKAVAPTESKNGWDQGRQHYYENGEMVRSREIYDRQDGNWYWVDGDGTMARNKDVYLRSNGGKWVRYDANGHMIKGEDCRYGGWYYFDRYTGAMAKGMTFVPSNGGKWVYYDWITGKMAYGERFVNYDAAHTGWYHFDERTGAMTHGFYYNAPQRKWVCYDPVSGQMLHGQHAVNGHWYDFDDTTGAVKYGFVYHAKQQKWVVYDRRMGWMLYGEQPIDGAWYLLDPHTGAVQYGWQWVGGKHVCYDWPSGRMLYGWHSVNGANYYFNTVTGAVDTRRSAAIPQDTVQASAGVFGTRIRQGKYHSVRILGDSIAAGVGSDETYPYTSRELFQLEGITYYEPSSQSRMAVNSLRHYLESRGVSVTNASAPGKGSYSAYNSIGDDTLGHEDAAIVMLGANDRLRLSNANDFTAAAESYLNRVAARYGSQNVYVIANIDTLSDPRSLTMYQENAALQQICGRHGWQYASLYSAFQTVGRTTGMPQQALYTDGIHPNRMGQDVMWRAMRQLLGL